MKWLRAYSIFFMCAWAQNALSADTPQVPVQPSSDKVSALIPTSINAMNKKELKEHIFLLEQQCLQSNNERDTFRKILVESTAKFRLAYEHIKNQKNEQIAALQEEVQRLKEENAQLVSKQRE